MDNETGGDGLAGELFSGVKDRLLSLHISRPDVSQAELDAVTALPESIKSDLLRANRAFEEYVLQIALNNNDGGEAQARVQMSIADDLTLRKFIDTYDYQGDQNP